MACADERHCHEAVALPLAVRAPIVATVTVLALLSLALLLLALRLRRLSPVRRALLLPRCGWLGLLLVRGRRGRRRPPLILRGRSSLCRRGLGRGGRPLLVRRDDGWRLLSVGRQIERLHMLSHALARGFELRVHETDDGFELLLGLFDSVITYRAQFQGRREVLPLLHLLVMDTDNPRSLAWVARTLRDRLRKLARHEAPWAVDVTAEFVMPEDWPLARLASTDAAGRHSALIKALQDCSSATRTLSDEIGRHLFAHVESPDRRVWQ